MQPTKNNAEIRFMPCPEMLHRICTELKEDIDSEVCQEVKQHLDTCPDCRAYVDSLKKTVYLYRQISDQNVPHEVQNRLIEALKL